jgi:Pyruvate/2-oxoacid:ferredoxin oxidoreductase delta subunit
MDKPCIVCQENCPVSPKAISVREYFSPVITGKPMVVEKAAESVISVQGAPFQENRYSTGDYYCFVKQISDMLPKRIVGNTTHRLDVSPQPEWHTPLQPGTGIEIKIRLQRPVIVSERCIGCGVCEHECPVHGKPAIAVTAENESRHPDHRVTLQPF